MSSAIGVLLFHEHARLRSGLREMLRPYRDIVIVGEANTAQAAIEPSVRLADLAPRDPVRR